MSDTIDGRVLTKRRLGRTEFYVTPLGLGGAWIGGRHAGPNEEGAVSTVLRALELGINLIDTSPMYLRGESEGFVGVALEEWYRRGGRREDVILSTKTGTRTRPKDYSYEGTKRSVQTSLTLLKTDYIDVMLVHDPVELAPVLAPGGALEALQDLKAQGSIRAIGLGVRSHEAHRRCIETGEFDVSLTYRDFNLLDQSAVEGVLETATKFDVGVFNAMSIIGGLLGGNDPLQVAEQAKAHARIRGRRGSYYPKVGEVDRARALWEWTQSKNIGLLALNLQYCQREPRISSTLVGASTAAEIESDVAALSETITEEMWQELHERFGP